MEKIIDTVEIVLKGFKKNLTEEEKIVLYNEAIDIFEKALETPEIVKYLGFIKIKKLIYIPGRLINVITK